MKILMVHKFYYIEGGAERYVFNVSDLLRKKGHRVIPFAMDDPRNFASEYQEYFCSRFSPEQFFAAKGLSSRLRLARRILYNHEAQEKLSRLIEKEKPDLAHVHSVYHHLSPSVLFTLKHYHLPVMVTLHDYKLVCPNYIFLDGYGNLCEACGGKHFWHAVARKCFRNSYPASLLIAAEAYFHHCKKSYLRNVDVFVSPSRFLADKISRYGYRDKPVLVQPYTLDLHAYEPCYEPGNYYVFMGRLTPEKGLGFLLEAAKRIPEVELFIIGTGPLEKELSNQIREEQIGHIKLLGYKSGEELKKIVRRAQFTVVPSQWHDNSPLVIYESMALGKPVIAARMGGIPELIEDGVSGHVFERGDLQSFSHFIRSLANNREQLIKMGKNARKMAEERYGFDAHYPQLLRLYEYTRSIAAKSKSDIDLRKNE